jgi:hypothetical protein
MTGSGCAKVLLDGLLERTSIGLNDLVKPARKFTSPEKVDPCKIAGEQHEAYNRYVDGAPLE